MELNISNSTQSKDYLILLANAMAITLFLFFIDEGYYNFNWAREPFAWVIFLIYTVPIFICQFLVYTFLLQTFSRGRKIALATVLGSVFGLLITISSLYLLH